MISDPLQPRAAGRHRRESSTYTLNTKALYCNWSFWIDVGGTFTDCIARRPDGLLLRHKLLSSGATKGIVAGSTATTISASGLPPAPAGFWSGCPFRLLSADGAVVAESVVAGVESDFSTVCLSAPLGVPPAVGQSFELNGLEESPLLGIRYLLGLPASAAIPPVIVHLGTTRGTNALLTRHGAKTALVTTRGFGDILEIGYQNRPGLFDLAIRKRPMLYAEVMEIDERVAASGAVLREPDPQVIRRHLTELRGRGIESLAICLLHGAEHKQHERQVAEIARAVGFRHVSVSHETAPLPKIVPRGDTTVVDAYLSPVLNDYVMTLRKALPGSEVKLLTSAGALVEAEQFRGRDSILSGPAGGVVGMSRVAEAAGFRQSIGFDMGGTSTDVSRYDGQFEMQYETEKAGVRLVAPMLAIETVAAGGGSICKFDGVKLTVGPDSAGADPGPACYGRGGPLTVTDLNVLLGRIQPEFFPLHLDLAAVKRRLMELAAEVAAATGIHYSPLELADGLWRIANSNMVRALRSMSISRGCDPRDYVLVPFGGAAGQHACALAEELGMDTMLLHPDAGLLSARGIGLADQRVHRTTPLADDYTAASLAAVQPRFQELEQAAVAELSANDVGRGVARSRVVIRRRLDLRYRGSEHPLTIDEPLDGDYAAAFAAAHERLHGYIHAGRPLEMVAARIEAVLDSGERLPESRSVAVATGPQRPRQSPRKATVYFNALPQETQVFLRNEIGPGDVIVGPAIVLESASTTVLDPGWQVEVLSVGELLARRQASHHGRREALSSASGPESSIGDPVVLEIVNNRLAAIAEQMGVVLRNTASSVNVRERLDFSCALFTAAGELVVNAPHIPVHLGAMGETVRRILADHPELAPGDVFITNDPYRGGSHLPDVTVVTPVFADVAGVCDRAAPELLFFTASRAHHAEIGGVSPGSMPPFSKNLAEEGVLIRDFQLIRAGQSRFDDLGTLLRAGPHPTRAASDNLADIAAQVAANRRGEEQLLAFVAEQGWPMVSAYMRHIQTAAERKLRQALARFPRGRRVFQDHLDDGAVVRVALDLVDSPVGPALMVDFTGTSPVHSSNLNANRSIVIAALMYVLRLLIDEDIPLNEGVLKPVRIALPECLLNPPERAVAQECAAVVGGNVETSQRVVDVLLGAFGMAAASQGTMNNFLFGDATFGYYETICGGAGATAKADGADAVHTHMTNTRLTDPEILERRYSVRLRRFAIRRDSAGAGRRRGGQGVVREIEFLQPLEVSIISERRGPYPPYGMDGGQPGGLGRNTLVRADGQRVALGAKVQFDAEPGDVLIIETPGGGGWGAAS